MKLHGVPQSNFYNMAKQSLLEKGPLSRKC